MPELVVITGLAAAGKMHRAKQLLKEKAVQSILRVDDYLYDEAGFKQPALGFVGDVLSTLRQQEGKVAVTGCCHDGRDRDKAHEHLFVAMMQAFPVLRVEVILPEKRHIHTLAVMDRCLERADDENCTETGESRGQLVMDMVVKYHGNVRGLDRFISACKWQGVKLSFLQGS